jgi:hypothetical protein
MNRFARTLAPILLQMLCAAGAIAGGVVAAVLADHQIHATGAAHTAWLAIFACLGMAASGDLLGRLTARTEVCPDCASTK